MNDVVYFIRGIDSIKIGTTTNIKSRLSSLQTSSAHDLELLGTIPGSEEREAEIHSQLDRYHKRGEWFHDCEEVRSAICELCGRNVFERIAAEPVVAPEPPMSMEEVCQISYLNSKNRLRGFIRFLLKGSDETWTAPEFKAIPMVRRHLILAAIMRAEKWFNDGSAKLREIDLAEDEKIKMYACCSSTAEQLECHVEFILGHDYAAYLDDWKMEPRVNPCFLIENGRFPFKTCKEANDAGWVRPEFKVERHAA